MNTKITATIISLVLASLACGPLADDLELDLAPPQAPVELTDASTLACSSLDGLDVQLADPPKTCDDLGLPKTVCAAGDLGGPASTLVCCSLDGLDCALIDPPSTCADHGFPKTVCAAS